jgi:hypothetical protein
MAFGDSDTLLHLLLCCFLRRLLIIGDVHGDLNAFHSCLKMAGVIDADMQWSGGKTVLVQCGDVFDRGECDLEVEEELYRLGEQAEASGGTCISLLGNHEVMNACGDHSMAVRKAFEPFQELRPDVDKFLSGDWDILAKFPDWAKCRIGAMLPAGPVAKLLAGHPLALKVGKTLVVHGGLLPQHVPSGIQSLHDMNTEAFEWLVGIKRTIPDNLMREESPIWTRKYSSPNDMELGEEAASDLKTTLDLVGCDRMVVGHTPQRRGINAAASGQVWRVDTGMTQMMGGAAEVLEILNGTVARIITADGPLEGEELQRLRYAPRGAPIGRFVKNSSTSSGE